MLWQLNYSVLNKLILLLILAIRGNSCSQVCWLFKTGTQNSLVFCLPICIQEVREALQFDSSTGGHSCEAVNILMLCLLHLHHCWEPRTLPCCRGWELKLSTGCVTPRLLWPGMQLPVDAAITAGYHSQAMGFDTGLPSHTCHSGMTQHIFCIGLVVFYG